MKTINFLISNSIVRTNIPNLKKYQQNFKYNKIFTSTSSSFHHKISKNITIGFQKFKKIDFYLLKNKISKSNTLSSFLNFQKQSFCQNIENSIENIEKFQTSLKYKFHIGSVKIPHFAKRKTGGEDALSYHDGMICVADGVGGWNEIGVDPSKYSNELCNNIKREYLTYGHKYNYNPKSIFIEAAKKTISQGSSTFCMCTLDFEKNYLHTVNMGDSGYMIIRDFATNSKFEGNLENIIKKNEDEKIIDLKILFKSAEQQHQFNFPYQVGSHGDPPEDSEINVHEIRENDIIVLGTDGLWDNLFEEQILAIIKPFYETTQKIKDLDLLANLIAELAEKLSLSPKYKSPFSVKSKGLYLGGKSDDITIIVAQIVPNHI